MKFQVDQGIQILSKTPSILQLLLGDLPDAWVMTNEGDETWSPYDIVGHLIHGEKTDWVHRAKIILGDQENKTFIPFDRFAQFEDSKGKTLARLLEEFRNWRLQNIEALKAMELDDEKLQRKGMHPDLGEVSLSELLATWVAHDLSHINQMTRVMARNYRGEVGPWRAYISVLK